MRNKTPKEPPKKLTVKVQQSRPNTPRNASRPSRQPQNPSDTDPAADGTLGCLPVSKTFRILAQRWQRGTGTGLEGSNVQVWAGSFQDRLWFPRPRPWTVSTARQPGQRYPAVSCKEQPSDLQGLELYYAAISESLHYKQRG